MNRRSVSSGVPSVLRRRLFCAFFHNALSCPTSIPHLPLSLSSVNLILSPFSFLYLFPTLVHFSSIIRSKNGKKTRSQNLTPPMFRASPRSAEVSINKYTSNNLKPSNDGTPIFRHFNNHTLLQCHPIWSSSPYLVLLKFTGYRTFTAPTNDPQAR